MQGARRHLPNPLARAPPRPLDQAPAVQRAALVLLQNVLKPLHCKRGQRQPQQMKPHAPLAGTGRQVKGTGSRYAARQRGPQHATMLHSPAWLRTFPLVGRQGRGQLVLKQPRHVALQADLAQDGGGGAAARGLAQQHGGRRGERAAGAVLPRRICAGGVAAGQSRQQAGRRARRLELCCGTVAGQRAGPHSSGMQGAAWGNGPGAAWRRHATWGVGRGPRGERVRRLCRKRRGRGCAVGPWRAAAMREAGVAVRHPLWQAAWRARRALLQRTAGAAGGGARRHAAGAVAAAAAVGAGVGQRLVQHGCQVNLHGPEQHCHTRNEEAPRPGARQPQRGRLRHGLLRCRAAHHPCPTSAPAPSCWLGS